MTEYSKIKEYIKMAARTGIDLDFAAELGELLRDYYEVISENEILEQENKALKESLKNSKKSEKPDVPQFPEDFDLVADLDSTYCPDADEIQDMIDTLAQFELEEGQFVETALGDTLVIKARSCGADNYYVVQGYYHYTNEDPETSSFGPDCCRGFRH